MKKLISFKGRIGRLGFALIYLPMLIACIIWLMLPIDDYLSDFRLEIPDFFSIQVFFLQLSLSICMSEIDNTNHPSYWIFPALSFIGWVSFVFISLPIILFITFFPH